MRKSTWWNCVLLLLAMSLFVSCAGKSQNKVFFISKLYQVELSYPSSWLPLTDSQTSEIYAYQGKTGFFSLSARKNKHHQSLLDLVRQEAFSTINDYGSSPEISRFFLHAREAYYIFPSSDQDQEELGKSCMVCFFPVPIMINSEFYDVFALYADRNHIEEIVASLRFLYQ